jgi:hypothetical protein
MKKGLSILLSFILLASQGSFTIGTHFCGGKAVESKVLFSETQLGCDMMEMEKSCDVSKSHNSNDAGFDKTPCCANQYHTFLSTAEFVNDATQIAFSFDFAAAIINTKLNLDFFPKATKQFYTKYHSPPIEKDIQVLFQSILC